MPIISLRLTEEELEQRITEAATKASQQVAKALANEIMQMSLMRVPLEISPDELLLITVVFPDEADDKKINEITQIIHNAFVTRGITRVLVLPSSKMAKINVSLIKQTDVDAGVKGNVCGTSYEYDGTTRLKQ